MAKGLFDRYIWLIDTIYRAGKITFEEINKRWLRTEMSNGEEIPLRTFHNHRKAIETMFDINIECNKRSGYYYYIENADDIDKDNLELIDAYMPRNRHGYVRRFNLIESYFVQLPFIKVIEKERGIKSFSKSEILIYILYQGLTHDIMTLDNEVVTIMKDKLEQFNEDEGLVLAAEKRQLVKIQHYQEEQRIRKESLEEGKAEGELLKAKENTIALFKSKFSQEHDEILENLTLEKYNLIFDALINDQDLERIKEIISRD